MNVKMFFTIAIGSMLIGCSSINYKEDQLIEKPRPRVTNLSDSLMCAKKEIESSDDRTFGFIFIIDDVVDGTVPSMQFNGELSDSLRYEFLHNLIQTVNRGYGITLSNFPLIFQNTGGDFGLSQYGVPLNTKEGNGENGLAVLINSYLKIINGIRERARKRTGEQISPYTRLRPIVIKSAFTRNDENPVIKNNLGFNIGSDGDADGEVDFGKSEQVKSITLTVIMEDPRTNQVVASGSFTINTHEKGHAFDLSIGGNEPFLGITSDNLLVESKHGAQQSLIDAATLWLLDWTYGPVTNISHNCMGGKS
ncbi:hypothetical protein [Candidatus Venteria ishoeyi]|uniref:Uncharacterized protein n=1 Tax=Candidatus Venteria ishoeyi TaxID=1899563 RepID=A0A1H6F7S9_9GAMM|nr:hypothetical protein [Candidatus Venteria ishoeyi]SEH05441.1 Uncharacterised protein [Candidatus Venteria ishoeyi]